MIDRVFELVVIFWQSVLTAITGIFVLFLLACLFSIIKGWIRR